MKLVEISGGATGEESAAIAAAVAHLLFAEAEALSAPPPRPRQSDWVMAWRSRVPHPGSRPGPVPPPRRSVELGD